MRKAGEAATSLVEDEVQSFLNGEMMKTPLDALTLDEAMASFAVLTLVERRLEERKEALREALLDTLAEHGEPTEKGGTRLYRGGILLVREKRTHKSPLTLEEVRNVLKDLPEVSMADITTEKKVTVLDPSKVEKMVRLGHLPKGALDQKEKVSYALKARMNENLHAALLEVIDPRELAGEESWAEEQDTPVGKSRWADE